jgi:hypothetical protein
MMVKFILICQVLLIQRNPGAFNAIESAIYLKENYVLHIIVDLESRKKLESRIKSFNKQM